MHWIKQVENDMVVVCQIWYPEYLQIILKYRHLNSDIWDNDAHIAQLIRWYFKEERIKHMSPNFFHTHEPQQKWKDLYQTNVLYG